MSINAAHQPWPCDEPVSVSGRCISLHSSEPDERIAGGNCLWPVSVIVADMVASMADLGNVCDLGCGLGLVGIAAAKHAMAVTLIDSDERACELATLNARNNNCTNARIVHARFDEITESFDSIFSTETVYLPYSPKSIAEFIQRNWTRNGPCIVATAVADKCGESAFEDRAAELHLGFDKTTVRRESPNGSIDFNLWRFRQ